MITLNDKTQINQTGKLRLFTSGVRNNWSRTSLFVKLGQQVAQIRVHNNLPTRQLNQILMPDFQSSVSVSPLQKYVRITFIRKNSVRTP